MTTPLRKSISRAGTEPLPAEFGPDRDRTLVVTITPSAAGDMLSLRPMRTRRAETVLLVDVYRWAIRNRVARQTLERVRRRLEKLKEKRKAKR